MKRYHLAINDGGLHYWCRDQHHGYWSLFEGSRKNRVNYLLPFAYLMKLIMKIHGVERVQVVQKRRCNNPYCDLQD